MTQPQADGDPRRRIPRTDVLLAQPQLAAAAGRVGPDLVRTAVTSAQQRARRGEIAPEAVPAEALAQVPAAASSLRPVVNATGVVLHTNLGRAPLSPAAVEALTATAGYVDVEYDVHTGARARRGRATLEALRRAVPAAQDVLVLNNGAAALVLATTALAADREVVISRGEMVEIGDGFRLHELIASTGARLHEVGTTNRTKLADYADAVSQETGCLLKVHPSNFRVDGFASAATVSELATLGVPLVVDIGSGLLSHDPLLPEEPDAASVLDAGADLVTCSGDKLLGGPQAGLVLGRRDLIEQLRRHPLARALRVDKLTLAALEATLRGPRTPTHRQLHADAEELRERCVQLRAAVLAGVREPGAARPDMPADQRDSPPHHASDLVAVVPSDGAVGGGGAPGLVLPGWALALPESCAAPLREGEPPVVGRVERGRTLLDLRCVAPDQQEALAGALRRVLATVSVAEATPQPGPPARHTVPGS